jgi:hypothetical protein
MKSYTKIVNGIEFKISNEMGYWRAENKVEVYASKTKRGVIKAINGDFTELLWSEWK